MFSVLIHCVHLKMCCEILFIRGEQIFVDVAGQLIEDTNELSFFFQLAGTTLINKTFFLHFIIYFFWKFGNHEAVDDCWDLRI